MSRVFAIMATCGRHTCVERSIRMFLDQDYVDKTLLIYNNSPVYQKLDHEYPNVMLANRPDPFEGGKYKSLGHIYEEAVDYLSYHIGDFEMDDVIIFWDDDDLFLPNHISEGVKGLEESGKVAYKPKYSFYRSSEGISKTENTLEPSIFVRATWVDSFGFSDTTTEQHLQWVSPLIESDELTVNPAGTPTLIYNWGDTHISTYKTSGDFHNPENFNNCRRESKDHGDQIITPISTEEAQKYYIDAPRS